MNKRYLIALTSLLVLTACGQKGPLYLPAEDTIATPAEEQDQPRHAQPESIELASQRKQEK
jgi:predicted small lipoprotein YifL